jgi:hypothetical protein
MSDRPAAFRGDDGQVNGRFNVYQLKTVPDWHADAEADVACGRVLQSLEVTLHFDDADRLPQIRRTAARLTASAEATLVLDDLTFVGRVTSSNWSARADADGRVRTAALTLHLQGYEA